MKYIYLKVFSPYVDLHVKELSLNFDFRPSNCQVKRLNLLLPSISGEHRFGGINTALQLFDQIAERGGFQKRIIVINAAPDSHELKDSFPGYQLVSPSEESKAERQVLPCISGTVSVPVGKGDFFVATAWWTAFCAQKIADWQSVYFPDHQNTLLYLIQDYEPGFYPWSSEYLLADSTYKYPGRQIALFNTKLLREYFHKNGYRFQDEFWFETKVNEQILKYRNELNLSDKKKQIVVYGRPSVPRNAFALIHESLKIWAGAQPDAARWRLISVGEKHRELDLGNGARLLSWGKLSLAEYARLLAESSVGLSLMVSPHPSYPPLEMAEFGLHVITNSFQAKDLSGYYQNITSLSRCMPDQIAGALMEATGKEPLNRAGVRLTAEEETVDGAMVEEIVRKLGG